VLTQTLRTLERDGLVQRTSYAEMPPRVEYALTPLGLTLRDPLQPSRDWAKTNFHEVMRARQHYGEQD
jgi:DNA-binding HxlR family transcriptional regulator